MPSDRARTVARTPADGPTPVRSRTLDADDFRNPLRHGQKLPVRADGDAGRRVFQDSSGSSARKDSIGGGRRTIEEDTDEARVAQIVEQQERVRGTLSIRGLDVRKSRRVAIIATPRP
jgi:hypothetical protein